MDLDRRVCSCGFYRESEIPWSNMCAALFSLRDENVTRFVTPEWQRDAQVQTSVGFIMPVDVSLLAKDALMPPEVTKMNGRLKEKRIPSCVEKGPRKTVRCGRCGGRGHNARTCKKTN